MLALSFPAFGDGGGGDGGNYKRSYKLDPFHKLIEAEQYQKAIDELSEALSERPDDADLLNLYAFSQRKLKRYDEALEHYQKALAIDPDHRGANEYLGELYLQLGDVDKARERLAVLDDECFWGCKEFDKLERAIEEYLRENPS
ncbi:MAG: tetratricopeptide repeat protein [Proteobacteria bacterium]|nr:tetratricopeptide repeat protein [Pseudomonadota bacterium]